MGKAEELASDRAVDVGRSQENLWAIPVGNLVGGVVPVHKVIQQGYPCVGVSLVKMRGCYALSSAFRRKGVTPGNGVWVP